MRLKAGEVLPCFNGCGQRFSLTLDQTSKRSVQGHVSEAQSPEQASFLKTHLALSLLKGQAMDRAIQLATELGATELSLVRAERSNVNLSGDRVTKKLGHWQKIIVSASEQCGRLHLPSLTIFSSWSEFRAQNASDATYVLDMNAPRISVQEITKDVCLLVGPEGGFSPTELASFNAMDIHAVSIGTNTLRAETAPGIALALVEHLRSGA